MAPKNKSPAAGTSDVSVNGVNGAAPQPDFAHVVTDFLTGIQTLSSNNGFQELFSFISKIPQLEKDIKARDEQVATLKGDIENLKTKHAAELQNQLNVYSKSRSGLDGEITSRDASISSLKVDIEKGDKTIAELRKENGETQKRILNLGKILEEKGDAIGKLQSREMELLSEQSTRDASIKELEQNLNREKSRVSQLEKKLSALEKENSLLREEFQASSDRLKELEDLAEPLRPADEDVSSVVNKLEGIWKPMYRLVDRCFQNDLPSDILQNSSAWKKVRESEALKHHIPLPQTNTLAAKQMRIALILAILARSINHHIFQPTYILDEESGIRERLLLEAVACGRRESFCRALLLKMSPKKQDEAAKTRVTQVVDEVMQEIQDLIPADNVKAFRSNLEKVAKHACDVWREMQRTKEKFEPSFELPPDQDSDWQSLPFGEKNSGDQAPTRGGVDGGSDEILLVIFPRFYIVEDDDPEAITSGIVLRRSQSVAAAQELEKARASHSAFAKSQSPRSPRAQRRRMSAAANGAGNTPDTGAFLPQASASS